jgi:cyclopropane-fatty-acyl-phospholipid synthase
MLIETALSLAERAPLPDFLTSAGIEFLVSRTSRKLVGLDRDTESRFAEAMRNFPIAAHTARANAQHYELPPEFFALVLGPRLKYSCCLYPRPGASLAEAEALALEETVLHAGLADGQRILELGCGWGSLSLFIARKFPHTKIVAVSNSNAQRRHIEEQARGRGLNNLTVLTADMNEFAAQGHFDRIVSVEMFEHMSNWTALLARARDWLTPDGRLFLHVFTHRAQAYRFDQADRSDWIAQHFFTGGVMPSQRLIHFFPDLFEVEQEWRWSGEHYRRTARDWLANFDSQSPEIDALMSQVYGRDAALWTRRWRLFFLSVAGLFGHAGGAEWGVGHYRLAPAPRS